MAVAEDEAEAEAVEPQKPILIVDPDPASRNAGEDLEDDLERPVVAIDSVDFDPEAMDEIGEAEVFIICWDLGFRAGVDLIEQIRADESLRDRIVIVASNAPTHLMVHCAIEAGADGICTQPYDADEIAHGLADAEALEDRGHGAELIVAAKNRVVHQPLQIFAFGDRGADCLQIGGNAIERVQLVGQVKKSGRITSGNVRYDANFGCHGRSTFPYGRVKPKSLKILTKTNERTCGPQVSPGRAGYVA